MMTEISCYTYSSSSFYVIIEPSVIEDRQLRMPDRFVQEHGNDLLSTVRLIVPTDDFWCVGLKKAGKMIWLHDGWQEFMEHHSIDCWYFLLFKYGQNSRFNVHIFDLAATEIHYRLRGHGNAKLHDISRHLSHGKENIVGDNGGESSVEIVDPLETEQGPDISAKPSELAHGAKKCKFESRRSKFQRCCETRSKANKLHDEGRVINGKNLIIVGDSSLTKPLMSKSVQQNMDTSVYSALLAGGVTNHENAQEGNKNDILQLNENKHAESSKAFGPVSSNRTNCKTDRRKSFTGQQLEKSVRRGRPPKRGRPLATEAKRTIDAEKLFMPKDPYFMQIHYRLRSHGNAKLHDISQDLSHGKEKVVGNNDRESSVEIVDHLETEQGPESSPQSSELSHGAKRRKISPGRIKRWRRYEMRSNTNELPVSLNRISCKNDTCKSFTGQQLEKSARHGTGRPHKRGRPWAAEANWAINAAKMFIPENPYFTKILLEYNIVRAYILNISSEFVREYMPKTSNVIELQDCDGNKWNVRCIRRKDQICLCKGWSNFVKDTSLVAGDVCVFELMTDIQTDEHILKVHIFHSRVEENLTNLHTCCLTEPTLPVSKTCILESKDTESSDAFGPLSSNKTNCKSDTGKSFINQQLEKSVRPHKRGQPSVAEANRAKNAAKMFYPKNPYFMQILVEYNVVRNYILNIPAEFSWEYMPKTSKIIKLQNSDGNKWNVRCIRRKDLLSLSQGWLNFVRDNSLEVGDVCVFELIKDLQADELMLNVHIFRARVEESSTNLRTCSVTEPILPVSKTCTLQFSESKDTESSDAFLPLSSNKTDCMTDTGKSFTSQQLEKSARPHKRGKTSVAEVNRAKNAAKMFMPKNPSFTAILAKYNVVRHYILNIPAEFFREHMPKTSEVIKLQNSEGNMWNVRCIRRKYLLSLSQGWLNFVRDNCLEVGDVCVFELIKDLQADELMLKVHIFRARVEENSTTPVDTLVAYLNQLSISK